MSKILIGIPYLEMKDVMQDGSLPPKTTKGRPVVLMVQGNFCHYCTDSKPDFQAFAESTPEITALTIQTDDGGDGQALGRLYPTQGVPAFIGFSSDGKFKSIHQGPRSVQAFKAFAKTL
jgi:thiol-disulfide isomerase/thioredoxin